MAVKVGINGFGRIGRQVLKATLDLYSEEIEVVAVHDIAGAKDFAHLFKYDSNYGQFPGEVMVDGDDLVLVGESDDGIEYERRIKFIVSRVGPDQIPWGDYGVDIVLESTGLFLTQEAAEGHIKNGAKKVILSAPAKGDIKTIVLGVNDDSYDPNVHHIISNASCTTNCLAPVAKVLHESFGIVEGLMTTIHSYTNDQRILDLPHSDMRRMRAAALNMIPTTTGAAKAIGLVLPALKGKLNGLAMRVPTPTVSIVDLVVTTEKPATVESVNAAFKAASESDEMEGILGYTEEPLVSMDFKGDSRSSIVDALSTMVIGDKMVKVLAWYDNEWGYSTRCADLMYFMGYDDEGNQIL